MIDSSFFLIFLSFSSSYFFFFFLPFFLSFSSSYFFFFFLPFFLSVSSSFFLIFLLLISLFSFLFFFFLHHFLSFSFSFFLFFFFFSFFFFFFQWGNEILDKRETKTKVDEKWDVYGFNIFFFFAPIFFGKKIIRSMSWGAFANLSNSICLEIYCQSFLYWTIFLSFDILEKNCISFLTKKYRKHKPVCSTKY